MARYIDADKLARKIRYIFKTYGVSKVITEKVNKVLNDSTADVVEVKHGEWENVRVVSEEYGFAEVYYQHKDCKISPTELYKSPYEHCPRCGAIMNGGKTE